MNRDVEKIGKGDDDNLKRYRYMRERRRFIRRVAIPVASVSLLLLLALLLFLFGFRVKEIRIEGGSHYTENELAEKCGIAINDNLILLSQTEVEAALKKAFPYIKSVEMKKDFPSAVSLHITEEYTTFYYEIDGEFFLFNYDLRLMDKFDSEEALLNTRDSIYVEMPLPKSSIVLQYIQFEEKDAFVKSFFTTLSASKLLPYVNSLELTDKFVLRMVCFGNVTVELGDYTKMEEKLFRLYELLSPHGENLSGNVDLSAYPSCFYRLDAE